MPTRLSKMRIDRVSLVDRPAHPEAEVVISKRDIGQDDQESLVENTSFFVESAIIQESTTPTQEVVMNKEYGGEDMEADADMPEAGGKKKKMPKDVLDHFKSMKKAEDEIELSPEEDEDEIEEADVDDMIKSLPAEAIEYIEKLEDVVLELQDRFEKSEAAVLDDEETEVEEAEAEADEIVLEDDETIVPDDDDVEKFLKSADPRLAQIVKSAVDRAEAAERIAKRERDLRMEKEFIAKADAFSALPAKRDEIVAILKAVNEDAPRAASAIEELLKRCNGALAESGIFKSEGQGETGTTSTTVAQWDSAVDTIRKADTSLSYEQAFAKALDQHPELYEEYLTGKTR